MYRRLPKEHDDRSGVLFTSNGLATEIGSDFLGIISRRSHLYPCKLIISRLLNIICIHIVQHVIDLRPTTLLLFQLILHLSYVSTKCPLQEGTD